MPPKWLKVRRYRHFDLPVNESFVRKAESPQFVSAHSFSPLIHYTKTEKRYKKCEFCKFREIITKNRPIKYASHRDAAILAYYAGLLNKKLEKYYEHENLTDNIIAYRAIGKSNYHFAAEALHFAQVNAPLPYWHSM